MPGWWHWIRVGDPRERKGHQEPRPTRPEDDLQRRPVKKLHVPEGLDLPASEGSDRRPQDTEPRIRVLPTRHRSSLRPYLSFPRGIHFPSPRILFYGSDVPALTRRDLALAFALTVEFETGNVVLTTGSNELEQWPGGPRLEVVKVPGFGTEIPLRPLARERVRRLRRRQLASLFDAYLPDLVLLDLVGPEATQEARELLVRVTALESAHMVVDNPHREGELCRSTSPEDEPGACETCVHRIRAEARHAYTRLEGRRSSPRA